MSKLNSLLGFAIAIAIMTQGNNPLLAQATVDVSVVNQTDYPVTLKIVDVDLSGDIPKVDVQELGEVASAKKGKATTKSISIQRDADVTFYQNGKKIGVAQAKLNQKIFVRKPGIEFCLTNIYCLVADDEGASFAGDEIEFHGKLKVDVIYYDGNGEVHETPNDPVKIYVQSLDDDSSKPLSNQWKIAIPAAYIDSAQVKLTWSETWEEDNASSSKDDILFVDGGNERTLKKIESNGPYVNRILNVRSRKNIHFFRIRNAKPDADVKVFYGCKVIETFEVTDE